ncbi:MAG TPA: polyphosphate kinase 2, partial [Prochlorococcus sp.]|nr:polyphosphate kinase 2 [Prochlorococcus sp.]
MGKDKNKKHKKVSVTSEKISEHDLEILDGTDQDIKHPSAFLDAPHSSIQRLNKKLYESELEKLQSDLVRMQYWIKATGFRMIVLFEGRDAAGK